MVASRNAGALGPLGLFFALSLCAVACSSDDGAEPAGAAGTAGSAQAGSGGANASCDVVDGQFRITDDTNYSLPTSLDVEFTTLKDDTDLVLDWSALTQDFYGRSLSAAADIDMVLISLWAMTPEELRTSLEKDKLPRSENIGVITAYPDGRFTSENLLDFNLEGNPIPEEELWGFFDTQAADYEYPQDQYTFLAMASTGTVIGRNARMLSFFNLDPNSQNTELAFQNSSTELEFEAHITGSRPVRVPAATPGITIDWNDMMVNALGNEYLPAQITRAAVAHYETTSLADLENQFLDLETIALGWWDGEVKAGTSIELGTLLDQNQAAFPGIDGTGTWLVALFCTSSNCNHPAPWSITILKPCE